MIKKIPPLIPTKKGWPETTVSLAKALTTITEKINELVDQVNALTAAHTPAKIKGVDRDV